MDELKGWCKHPVYLTYEDLMKNRYAYEYPGAISDDERKSRASRLKSILRACETMLMKDIQHAYIHISDCRDYFKRMFPACKRVKVNSSTGTNDIPEFISWKGNATNVISWNDNATNVFYG
jgi:hypothetical protein